MFGCCHDCRGGGRHICLRHGGGRGRLGARGPAASLVPTVREVLVRTLGILAAAAAMGVALVVAQAVDVLVLLAAVGLRAEDERGRAGGLGGAARPRPLLAVRRRAELELGGPVTAAAFILGRAAGHGKSAALPVAELSLDRSCAGRCFGVTPSPLGAPPLGEAALSVQVASGRLTKPRRGPVVPGAVQQSAHVGLSTPRHVHHEHACVRVGGGGGRWGDGTSIAQRKAQFAKVQFLRT